MHVILTANFSPWSPYSGGGQRSTHNLAQVLARRGHDVEVVFTKPPWEQVNVPTGLPYALHWAALPARRSRRDAPLRPLTALTVALQVRALLRPGTVVHSNGEEAALLPALRRHRPFAFVLTPRYPQLPTALLQRRRTLCAALHLFFNHFKFIQLGAAARGAGLCCPTSRSAARMMQQAYGIDSRRLRIVPNGVSVAFMRAEHSEEAAARGLLIFFGRLSRSKGADTLLDALALLGSDGPKALIIGRGEQQEALAQAIRARGLSDRVALKGWMPQDELAGLLSRAAMAVLPSREESFGNAMAEAMATGTPVVSTTAGSVPEVVVHGKTGLLVPPDDPEALAGAIHRLQEDPQEARRFGVAGRQRVREHFTWNAAAERFEALYEEVLHEDILRTNAKRQGASTSAE